MRRILVVLAVVLATMALALPPAAGQSAAEEPPMVTYVDARDGSIEAAVLAADYSIGAADVRVEQNGETIESVDVTTAVAAGWPVEMVFVVDTDRRNAEAGELVTISRAVLSAAENLPDGSRVGLVTAGGDADVEVGLTTSLSRLDVALQQLGASQGAALVDAVTSAGELLAREGGPGGKVVRSVVVIAGGADIGSTGSSAAASSSLIQGAAQLVTVELESAESGLDGLVASAGGASTRAETEEGIATAVADAVAVASNRLVVGFDEIVGGEDGDVDDRVNMELVIGDDSRLVSYPRGLETVNILQLDPLPDSGGSRFGFLGQPWVLYLSILLAFLGISMAIWSLASMFGGGETQLDRVLARYADGEDVDDDEVREMLVQTELLQRAVDFTEQFAQRQGFLTRIEGMLERADLPIRPGEAMFFLTGLVVLVFALAWTLTTSLFLAILLALLAAFGGYGAVIFMAHRRLKTFEAQLPDTLQLLAGTLRAGYSLPQGIDAVSNEIADPMGEELRRAMTEAQLGRELEDALAAVAERLDSEDFGWAVMAIGIQREVGGNLNELLMTVSETMVQRERLKREVAALTAEGRVSALILSLMPPGLGVVLFVMNPDYVTTLFNRTIGLVLLGLATVSALIGLLWMKKVITIDA